MALLLKLLVCLVGVINCFQGVHLTGKEDELAYLNGLEANWKSEDARFPLWRFTFPGTKWCGMGNTADSYEDLGEFKLTDKCCRRHDACDDHIGGYQTAHNLTNNSFYTRLSCTCDKEFYKCLKSVDTTDSIAVGAIYFNFLGTQCFRKEYPILSCKEYVYVPKKCISYAVDRYSQKAYQWFDVPVF